MGRILPLVFQIGGYEAHESFRMDTAVLQDEKDTVLIDAGTPGIEDIIEQAFSGVGIAVKDLTGIVITHQDHIGSLAALKRKAPGAKIYASEVQAPGISGREKPLRFIREEAEYAMLPAEQKAKIPEPASLWPRVEYAEIDVIVHDGDLFPWCGGTEIVFTEGHMPGHFSLYIRETKTFIAGDALALTDKGLSYRGKFTMDHKLARKNLHDAAEKYEIREILCYHGGFWHGDGSAALARL
jgi:glyoxylase-like metal-dependent hydrolase (beta-lactamase superfamily II)